MNDSFEDRLRQIRDRMQAACEHSGRAESEVELLPISKGFGPEQIQEAVECGLKVFGESRVQEAAQKVPLCAGNLAWHMVGHLQRNKARMAVQMFKMIHSVDSVRLLRTIDCECREAGVRMPICVEVNVAGEATKFGADASETAAILEAGGECMNIEVVGLMAVPPVTREPEDARPYFRSLRELRDKLRDATGMRLPHLSMGMSQDYEVAIEEGATWIRVGSALFGNRR